MTGSPKTADWQGMDNGWEGWWKDGRLGIDGTWLGKEYITTVEAATCRWQAGKAQSAASCLQKITQITHSRARQREGMLSYST